MKLGGGGDDRASTVHVGSPRYMREAGFFTSSHRDASSSRLDPVVRRLLSDDDIEAGADADVGVGVGVVGEPDSDRKESSAALLVSVFW